LSAIYDLVDVIEHFEEIRLVLIDICFIIFVVIRHFLPDEGEIEEYEGVSNEERDAENGVLIEEITGDHNEKGHIRQYERNDVVEYHETYRRHAIDRSAHLVEIHIAEVLIIDDENDLDQLETEPLPEFCQDLVLKEFIEIVEDDVYHGYDDEVVVICEYMF
jgi:hypothetical protein